MAVRGWIACDNHQGIVDVDCPDCAIPRPPEHPKAVLDIIKEFNRATELFGPFHSAHEGYAILLEEMDELWDEVKKHRSPENYQRMMDEAVQVGAMALRFIVDMKRLKDN